MEEEMRASLLPDLSGSQSPSISPVVALKNFWVKAVSYSGRATRAEYNWPLLMFVVVSCVPGVLFVCGIPRSTCTILAVAVWVVFLVPWLALVARRCHDINRPGTFGLLLLATGIGFLVIECVLMFTDSDPRGVRFDPTVPPADRAPRP